MTWTIATGTDLYAAVICVLYAEGAETAETQRQERERQKNINMDIQNGQDKKG